MRVRFLSIAGQHSLLVIENGYDRAIAYRAQMIRGNEARPTDVCIVMPHKHGFEHWPFVIDRLEISEMHFVDWRIGDPIALRLMRRVTYGVLHLFGLRSAQCDSTFRWPAALEAR